MHPITNQAQNKRRSIKIVFAIYVIILYLAVRTGFPPVRLTVYASASLNRDLGL